MRNATICFLAAATLAAPAAFGAPGARLHVLRDDPAVVRGELFKSGERVTIVLYTERRWTRTPTASDRGVITVAFPVALPDCGRYSLQAFGSKGSRARSLAARSACGDPTR